MSVKATVYSNGPVVVVGDIEVLDGEGKAYPGIGEKVAFCRCGLSANKPFCDGTHAKEGFTHEAVAPDA